MTASLLAGNVLLCLAPSASAAVSFSAPTSYVIVDGPQSVAVGDFNADSDPDLAVPTRFTNDVSVLLGGADGSFTGPTSFAAGPSPIFGTVGDFNADGDPDLAVANIFTHKISVLLGGAGATFSPPTDYAVGTEPVFVAVADFNGDGDPDLAVVNQTSDDISVLVGAAGGTFAALPTTFPTGGDPDSIAVGDFNGDGDPDLAVADDGGAVSVLVGGADASFSAPTSFAAGAGPDSVAVADFNGDGDPDLAVANSDADDVPGGEAEDVSILLGEAGASFSAPTTFAAGVLAREVAVGDFNADGDPDLAVANQLSEDVSVLIGGAGGSFSAPLSFAAGAGPRSIAVGDFNGDGDPDLAVANTDADRVSVLLNTSQPQVAVSPGAHDFGSVPLGQTGTQQAFTITNTGDGTASLASVQLIGTDASQFTLSENCGSTLGGGQSCTASITFAPTVRGAKTALLAVTDTTAGSPHEATLTGTAAAVTPNPSPAPTPSPGPGADTVAPVLTPAKIARQRLRTLFARGLRVRFTTSEPCAFEARLKLAVRGRFVTLGRARRSLPGDGPVSVTIRLSSAGKRQLRKARRPRLRVVLTCRDAAGNTGTARTSVAPRRAAEPSTDVAARNGFRA